MIAPHILKYVIEQLRTATFVVASEISTDIDWFYYLCLEGGKKEKWKHDVQSDTFSECRLSCLLKHLTVETTGIFWQYNLNPS